MWGPSQLRAVLILALPGAASARTFLQLEGIPGESTAVGFENQIEIQDFSFEVGKTKDKPAVFSEINVTKQLDKASPELMLRTANAGTIPSARIRVTRETRRQRGVLALLLHRCAHHELQPARR